MSMSDSQKKKLIRPPHGDANKSVGYIRRDDMYNSEQVQKNREMEDQLRKLNQQVEKRNQMKMRQQKARIIKPDQDSSSSSEEEDEGQGNSQNKHPIENNNVVEESSFFSKIWNFLPFT